MSIIRLSDAEIAIAQMVGAMRNISNQSSKVEDARITQKRSSLDANVVGMLAEIAFGKFRNLCPDLSIEPRAGGADFVGKNGTLIDVKATDHDYPEKYLVTRKQDHGKADIYVLAYVHLPNVSFLGWASRDQLINPANIRDFGYGPTYALLSTQLNPI